jgi:simple sugar transport system permease protein
MNELFVQIVLGISIASVPLIFAATGELLVERSGVLNLGVEGMMIVGAIAGFAVQFHFDNALLALISAIAAGMLLAAIFAFLTQIMLTNHVATGLALTLFGLGISAFWGRSYSKVTVDRVDAINIPGFSDLPVVGPLLFSYDPLFYLSILMVILVWYFLNKTKKGLILRAIGDNHDAAHSIGHKVVRYRFMAIIFGGAMAGMGGAYLSLVQVPIWVEGMTAGRGWIALALVVFASWQPFKVIVGAFIFGGISILQLHAQGFGLSVDAQYLSMLPYLMTIIVLVTLRIRSKSMTSRVMPNCLGKVFHSNQ